MLGLLHMKLKLKRELEKTHRIGNANGIADKRPDSSQTLEKVNKSKYVHFRIKQHFHIREIEKVKPQGLLGKWADQDIREGLAHFHPSSQHCSRHSHHFIGFSSFSML